MVGTIIQNWWHTEFLHWGYVHQAALMARLSRRLQRANTKEYKEEEEVKKLFKLRVVNEKKAIEEFTKYGKILNVKKEELFDIARTVRTVLQKDMERFSQLMVGIHDDPKVQNKDALHKIVIDMEVKVIEEAKGVMQSWGSFSSVTLTAWKAVDEASEIADLIYQARLDRVQTRKLKQALNKELSALRGGKLTQQEHEQRMKQIMEIEQAQIQQLTKILNHVVYLLQRLQKHIDETERMFKDEEAREQMPKAWETKLLKKVHEVKAEIDKFLVEELREDRVFVGDLEHQQAA